MTRTTGWTSPILYDASAKLYDVEALTTDCTDCYETVDYMSLWVCSTAEIFICCEWNDCGVV